MKGNFRKAGEFRAELFPEPLADDFEGWVFEARGVVEGGVVEFF